MNIRTTGFVILVVLFFSLPALCSDISVSGRVLDPQGKPIPGATVHLIH